MTFLNLLKFKAYFEKTKNSIQLEKVMKNLEKYPEYEQEKKPKKEKKGE